MEALHGFAANLVHTVSTNQLHSETMTHKEEKISAPKTSRLQFFGVGTRGQTQCIMHVKSGCSTTELHPIPSSLYFLLSFSANLHSIFI